MANTRNQKQAICIKQVDAPSGTFFALFDANGFGVQRSQLKKDASVFRYNPPNSCHRGLPVQCVLSVVLNATAICRTSEGLTVFGETETQ